MRIARALVTVGVAVLALPAVAGAKEPTRATIEGPSLSQPVTLTGDGEKPGTPLGDLTRQSGFAPAVFGHRNPDPMLRDRPAGDLGPRYKVTYTIWGADGDPVEQDVYPYALPRPVTYLPSGQSFNTGMKTYGGWFKADPGLRQTLVAAGLPPAPPSTSSADDFFGAPAAISAVALALFGTAAAAILLRRARHAPA